MNNIESIISRVKSDLSKYDDAGLLDENTMYTDAVNAVKRFGNDILERQEIVLDVRAGEAEIPVQFFSMIAAYLCKPAYYKTEGVEYHDLQSSVMYTERVERGTSWSDCESCCETKTENLVKENVYFKRGHLEFYYQEPTLLTLAPGFNKDICAKECRNLFFKESENEISINRKTLYANFNSGSVYMQFYGLPLDKNKNVDFNESKNGHLETYIEYHLKRRCAEMLIGNNDAQGLQTLYPIYKSEESLALRNASSAAKLEKVTPKAMKEWEMKNRLETLTYEISIPLWL